VSVVQGELKFTAKVPRVLLTDVMLKVAEPPPETVCVAGVTCRLIGACTLIVPVLVAVTVIVAEPAPFFLMDIAEGVALSAQPIPVPVMVPTIVPVVSPVQSTELLCTVLPLTTAVV